MTIEYKIWDFPTIPIQKQLFHVPGSVFEGGFTSGGARIQSAEPDGRSVLEVQVALQVAEWDFPFSSWIMSKTNGQIFRVPLTKTPQLIANRALNGGVDTPANLAIGWEPDENSSEGQWDNGQYWSDDGVQTVASAAALQGTNVIQIDMSAFGQILKHGHVFGIGDASYLVDDIEYSVTNIATVTVTPSLRADVAIGDPIYFRPYFLGTISNGSEITKTYDAENVGAIQIGRIIFNEVMI